MQEKRPKRISAPSMSFQTLKAQIEAFRGCLPSRLGKQSLVAIPKTVRPNALRALRFLALVDEQYRPSDTLRSIANNDEQRAAVWNLVIRASYRELFELNLPDVPYTDVEAVFQTHYCSITEINPEKHIAFFRGAAIEAKINISSGIRNCGGSRRQQGTTPSKGPLEERVEAISLGPKSSNGESRLPDYPEFNPAWEPEVQVAWFRAYSRIRAHRDQ